jgi:hypothetical protein
LSKASTQATSPNPLEISEFERLPAEQSPLSPRKVLIEPGAAFSQAYWAASYLTDHKVFRDAATGSMN